MRKRLSTERLISIFILGLVTTPAFAQQAPVVTLESVEVTGERQVRSQQSTTSSVTVVTEQEIQQQPAKDAFGLLQGAPNLTGTTAVGAPVIRGMETSGAGGLPSGVTQGTLPRAPFIVDEIARPSSLANTSFTSTWDMQQFEVLRGPQSTLRGRNAIAGAFIAKTKDPTFKPEAAAQAGLSFNGYGDPERTVAGMVSGPVIDNRVAVRVTHEHQGGRVPLNIVNAPAGRDGSGQNEYDQNRFRGKVLLTPGGLGEGLEIMAIADVQSGKTPANRYTVGGPSINGGRSFSDRAYPFGAQGGQRIFDVAAQAFAIDGSYWMGENRVRSITSFVNDAYQSSTRQSDTTWFDVKETSINQDLLYNFGSDRAPGSGVVGLNYGERKQQAKVSGITHANTRSETQAIFADGRHALGGGFEIVAGARLNRNEDDRIQLSLRAPQRVIAATKQEVTFLPKLGLTYDIDNRQRIGTTARRGYNPGGSSVNFLTGSPYSFESETVWTYEVFYRSSWLNNRLTVNLTGFHNEHTNPQLYIQRTAGNNTSLEVVNAGKGRSTGAELEAAMQVTGALKVTGGLGTMHTEILEGLPNNPGIAGNRFGRDPDFTGSIGAVWTLAEGFSVNSKVTYLSAYYSDVNNLTHERVGNYALADIGASYNFSNVTLRAFIDNITNKTALTRKIGYNFADLTPPRTLGFVATAKF